MAVRGGGAETVRVALSPSVIEEVRRLKAAGRFSDRYENEFLGYMIELGLKRYEMTFLPLEKGEDLMGHSPASGRAINQ